MTMGQANTSSSSKSAAPTIAKVTVSQATPVSAEDISESDSEDDTAPVSSLETVFFTTGYSCHACYVTAKCVGTSALNYGGL